MKLKDIGEFGLIERLKDIFENDAAVLRGIGDDAAVIKYTKNEYLLFASDMLVEEAHFKVSARKNIFEKIGHKALACNISDIAAMGGVPKYAVVNLAVSPDLNTGKVNKIFSGIKKTARKFNVNIVGGDLSKSKKTIITISIIGFVKKKNLVLRSGARAGDIIFVTGKLGAGRQKHLTFTPRLKEAQNLLKKYKINSMIDISDGLAQDLAQITKASGVGAVIYEELIPKAGSLKDALYAGEDFELLFTAEIEAAKKILKDKNIKAYEIGEILESGKNFDIVSKTGRREKLEAAGFRHF